MALPVYAELVRPSYAAARPPRRTGLCNVRDRESPGAPGLPPHRYDVRRTGGKPTVLIGACWTWHPQPAEHQRYPGHRAGPARGRVARRERISVSWRVRPVRVIRTAGRPGAACEHEALGPQLRVRAEMVSRWQPQARAGQVVNVNPAAFRARPRRSLMHPARRELRPVAEQCGISHHQRSGLHDHDDVLLPVRYPAHLIQGSARDRDAARGHSRQRAGQLR
jgi:hypothetical protein